ncbi:hypothetical protein [Propioniciclava soli]|uniref:Uncharacterized protein n=1 Tax=Propioniciclava soli TaxID=2775081 RepID=A0ABZ3CAP7_9ACTN|nr:hypothetical protein [Propioniciclava soli]
MNTIQKVGLGLGALALGVGAAVGVTNAAETATADTPATQTDANGSTPADAAPGADAVDTRGNRGTDPTTSGADTGAAGEGRRGGGPGARMGDLAADLATALDADEAAIQEAIDATMASQTPPSDGERPDAAALQETLATAIADRLGIDEATVTAALADLHPGGGHPGGGGGHSADGAEGAGTDGAPAPDATTETNG